MLMPDFSHVLAMVRDAAIRTVAEAGLRKVSSDVKAWWDARRSRAARSGSEERARLEECRYSETVDSLKSQLQDDASTIDWRFVSAEAEEPAVEAFIDDALSSAVETISEAKRLMLGRLIAKRLQTKSGTREELTLRRALEVIDKLTEEQLRLLAAICLVQSPPLENARPGVYASLDELEAAIKPGLFSTARSLKNAGGWIDDDFQTLISIGAISSLGNPPGVMNEHAGAIEQWSYQLGISPYDGLEGALGSRESQEAYSRRFPTIVVLKALAAGRKPGRPGEERFAQRLDEISLTPVGWLIGTIVLEQLLGSRLQRMALYSREIRAADSKEQTALDTGTD